jgi:O-methyltransferase
MWKERVNALLTKTTGYQLQKAGRAAAAPQPTARPARPKTPKGGPKAAGGSRRRFPAHMDENAIRVIQRVRPRTMTGKEKLFGLILATRYLAENSVPGDFVECGVWRGGSMQAAALTLIEEGDTRRHLHLFDTYEGMSEPTEKDRRNDGKAASELLAEAETDRKVWAYAGLEDVQTGMAELDYPQDQIHFHQGMVEETIPDQAPETIAMLRLDTDWYESTRHELEHLYHRLSPGGVLILDDYGHWEGARLAAQEFMKEHGSRLVLLPLGSGRIAIKPWA